MVDFVFISLYLDEGDALSCLKEIDIIESCPKEESVLILCQEEVNQFLKLQKDNTLIIKGLGVILTESINSFI